MSPPVPVARRRAAGLAAGSAAGLALALAGCGGHPATRAGVIARADAICASANAAVRAVPSPGSGSDRDLADYLERAAPILSHEATALAALPRPAAGRAVLVAFQAAETRTAADYRRLAALTRAGDAAAAQAVLSRLAGSPVARLAARYGARQCTGTAATVR